MGWPLHPSWPRKLVVSLPAAEKVYCILFGADFICFGSFLPNEGLSSNVKFRNSSHFVSCFRKHYSLLLQRRQPVIETYRFSCTLWSFDFYLHNFVHVSASFYVAFGSADMSTVNMTLLAKQLPSKMEVSVTKHHQLLNKCDSFQP